jgi:hypothetical protein
MFYGQCLFFFISTQAMYIKARLHNSNAMFSLKNPYTLAGFEPGPSVPGGGYFVHCARMIFSEFLNGKTKIKW